MADTTQQSTTPDVNVQTTQSDVVDTQTTQTEVQDTNSSTENDINEIANDISGTDDNVPSPSSDDTQAKPEEVDTQKENKQSDEFDPNEVNFDDETKEKDDDKKDEDAPIYKDIEGYDLEKYKDILDFDNEESLSFIQQELKTLKDAGFNQAQVDIFINSHLQKYMEEQEREKELNSREHITQNLKTKLTKEEQRNYKSMVNYMNEISDTGAFPKEWVKDAMSNPNFVKILNGVYKNVTNTNTVQEIPTPKSKAIMDTSVALDKYKEWITAQPKVTIEQSRQFVESLKEHIDEKEIPHFDEIFSSILKQ